MGRRSRIIYLSTLASVACAMIAAAHAEPPRQGAATKTRVYISSYTEQGHDGIYLAELDSGTGELKLVGLATEGKKISFLALHPHHKYLYASCEVDGYPESNGGAIAAYQIDPASGKLTLLNHQSSTGVGPHHLSLDREGKNALVANYFGGSVAVLPIGADGRLGPATSSVQHHGSSVHKVRQTGPHPHAINVDPTNGFAFVPDLGLDKVLVYRFDSAAGKLTPNDPGAAAFSPGAGPRHIAFHPNGRIAYVINELNSTVSVLRYECKLRVLWRIEDVSTLPAGATGDNLTGEIMVHPHGGFLYASNRGHDSIAVFSIDQTPACSRQ